MPITEPLGKGMCIKAGSRASRFKMRLQKAEPIRVLLSPWPIPRLRTAIVIRRPRRRGAVTARFADSSRTGWSGGEGDVGSFAWPTVKLALIRPVPALRAGNIANGPPHLPAMRPGLGGFNIQPPSVGYIVDRHKPPHSMARLQHPHSAPDHSAYVAAGPGCAPRRPRGARDPIYRHHRLFPDCADALTPASGRPRLSASPLPERLLSAAGTGYNTAWRARTRQANPIAAAVHIN